MVSRDLTLPEWPLALAPRTIGLSADAAVNYGPRPAIGAPQEVMNDAGLWRVSLIDIPIYEWKILAIRSLLLRMITQGVACRLPLWDQIRAPVVDSSGIRFSDNSTFADKALFSGVAPTGVVAAAASARASRITATVPAGVVLSGGQVIGIGDRAYCLWNAQQGESTWTLDFWPILRENVVIGDEIEFYNPLVKAKVDRDSARQALGELEYGVLGHLTLHFIEADWG